MNKSLDLPKEISLTKKWHFKVQTPKDSNMYEPFIILFPKRQVNIFILKSLETYTAQLKAPHTVLLFIQSGSQSTHKGLNCPCFFNSQFWETLHSKASSYTASNNTGLADAHYLVGSKVIWDTQIYVMKTISCTVFWWFCPHPIR